MKQVSVGSTPHSLPLPPTDSHPASLAPCAGAAPRMTDVVDRASGGSASEMANRWPGRWGAPGGGRRRRPGRVLGAAVTLPENNSASTPPASHQPRPTLTSSRCCAAPPAGKSRFFPPPASARTAHTQKTEQS